MRLTRISLLIGWCVLSLHCASSLHIQIRNMTPFVRWADTRVTQIEITLPAQDPGRYALVTVEDAMTVRDSVVTLTPSVQHLPWTIPVRTSGTIWVRIEIYDQHHRCLQTRIARMEVS